MPAFMLFGEITLQLKRDTREKRLERYREHNAASSTDKAETLASAQGELYESLDD